MEAGKVNPDLNNRAGIQFFSILEFLDKLLRPDEVFHLIFDSKFNYPVLILHRL